MTEQEQIEEMAFDLCMIDTCKHLPKEECGKTTCAHCEAEALYRAGYRKQVEGEWKPYKTPLDSRQTGWICSKCSSVIYDLSNGDTDFCPHCGARMKGGE